MMLDRMRKTTTLVAMIFGLMASMTATVATAGAWSGKTEIERVTVWSDRTVVVSAVSGSWANPDACDNDSKIVLVSPDSGAASAAYKELYAILLGAKISNREINVFLDGCAQIGNQTFPVFTQLAIF